MKTNIEISTAGGEVIQYVYSFNNLFSKLSFSQRPRQCLNKSCTNRNFDQNLVCKINFWKNKYITSPPAVEISLHVFLKPKHIIGNFYIKSTK